MTANELNSVFPVDYKASTQLNKSVALMDLKKIGILADALIKRIGGIPERDDPEHADMVMGFSERVEEIRAELEDVLTFGKAIGKEDWWYK